METPGAVAVDRQAVDKSLETFCITFAQRVDGIY